MRKFSSTSSVICDSCGLEATDDGRYAMPHGWSQVKFHYIRGNAPEIDLCHACTTPIAGAIAEIAERIDNLGRETLESCHRTCETKQKLIRAANLGYGQNEYTACMDMCSGEGIRETY